MKERKKQLPLPTGTASVLSRALCHFLRNTEDLDPTTRTSSLEFTKDALPTSPWKALSLPGRAGIIMPIIWEDFLGVTYLAGGTEAS